MQQRSEAEWNDLMNVLGTHAVAFVFASQFLAAATPSVSPDDWLSVLLIRAKTEAESCHSDQLQHYIAKTLLTLRNPDIHL
jgi:hypothetical protein